jgi:ribosomal protein S18 acetylase RimI-like enzyme
MYKIEAFSSKYQSAAASLINENLGRRFGVLDESMNPDLFDIESSYLDGYFFLALHKQKVLGTGGISSIYKDKAQIVRMHTHPDYRRLGIARSVLAQLEKTAQRHCVRELLLETNLNWVDAIQFYEAHGFTEVTRNTHGIRFTKLVGVSVDA